MQIIYADAIFVTNLIVDYLIMLATAKICAAPAKRLRLAGAAMIGSAYAVFAALPPMGFLRSPVFVAAVGLLMVLATFGGKKGIARVALVFYGVAAAFGGVIFAISLLGGGAVADGLFVRISFKALVLSFGACYAVVTVVFRRVAHGGGELVKLVIRYGDAELELRALVDTGNSLRDPITGLPVVVAGVSDVGRLFPRGTRKMVRELAVKDASVVMERLGDNADASRFQLIPYNAVGVSGGMLLAFRPDEVIVNGGGKKAMLLALSPNSISDNGTYTALLGA